MLFCLKCAISMYVYGIVTNLNEHHRTFYSRSGEFILRSACFVECGLASHQRMWIYQRYQPNQDTLNKHCSKCKQMQMQTMLHSCALLMYHDPPNYFVESIFFCSNVSTVDDVHKVNHHIYVFVPIRQTIETFSMKLACHWRDSIV